jgi:HNH endonuclease
MTQLIKMLAPIEGFSNYRVCNEGYIVHFPSMFRMKPCNETKNKRTSGKYEAVYLRRDDNKKFKKCRVHRLVCEMFHPNPQCHPIVDHIDGNVKNNHFLNLRWVSARESNLNRVMVNNRKYITGVYKVCNRYRVQFGRANKYIEFFDTYLEAAKYRLQLEKESSEFFRAQIPEKVTLEILNEIIDGF